MQKDDIKNFLKSIWDQKVDDLKPNDEGVVRIHYGWSTDDENDPKRYAVEAYEIGGKLTVMTGRGGMENLLKEGYIPLKVFYNGQPMGVDDFLKQFKELISGTEQS